MSATVTIGLPVWNAMPFLEDALRSIFAQTFTAWELIVVDDGSQDGGVELLRRLQHPRVRLLVDGEHRGLGARLNQIVSQAGAGYIARMDADDLMHPERLVRQVAFLEQNPEVHVAGCGLISFDGEQPITVRRFPAGHAEITAEPLAGFKLAHATVLGRAQWWRDHPYDEQNRGCEDWQLWFESRSRSHFGNLPDLLYFYREQQAHSLGGYARDNAELATAVWNRRGELGWAAATAAVAARWARIGVYAVAHLAGAEAALIRRRGTPPSEEQRRCFADALQRVRSTPLPLSA